MFCPMNPPVEDSVTCTTENRWLLGSLHVCERVAQTPNDALASWKYHGDTYCIRKASAERGSSDPGNSATHRFHQAGTSAAVWKFGGAFVKVKAWREGMQLESDTIQFVKSISSIPTPEIIHAWVDKEWNRSFLILKTLEGQTLDQAWESLSDDRRVQVASTIARFCKVLALSQSENLMTANHNGIVEPFLTALPPADEPSWKPQILGPLTPDQLPSYLSRSPALKDWMNLFYFYHADLGPKNILVAEDGEVVGVLDWESAAYYPKFWLGTKPLVSAGFFVRGTDRAWGIMLSNELAQEGFPSDKDSFHAWKLAIGNC